jgi:hypothetical protein
MKVGPARGVGFLDIQLAETVCDTRESMPGGHTWFRAGDATSVWDDLIPIRLSYILYATSYLLLAILLERRIGMGFLRRGRLPHPHW